MSNSSPAVSILMPVHNGRPFLIEALDDLLAQTFADFELIAVDDGSTDGTSFILESYASSDDRITIIRNDDNIGLPRALNRGLEACRAPLVARADADDRYPPDRLMRQVDFLRAHPEVGLLSCGVHKITAEGERFKRVRFPLKDSHIRIRELFVNSFSHPGVMFRTELVRSLGGYNPDYWTAEDAELWARLKSHTRMANVAEPLVTYRKHGSSQMQKRSSEGKRLSLSVRQRALSDYLGRPLDIEEARAIVALFRGQPVPAEEIDVGRKGLWEVLDKAKEQETDDTLQFYRREAANSLIEQSNVHVDSNRGISRTLFLNAIQWDPRLLWDSDNFRRAIRLLLPRYMSRKIRNVKSEIFNI